MLFKKSISCAADVGKALSSAIVRMTEWSDPVNYLDKVVISPSRKWNVSWKEREIYI